MEKGAMFRQRNSAVEGIQWDAQSGTANTFLGEDYGTDWEYIKGSNSISIPTLSGLQTVQVDDWIIKGVSGDFYPCPQNIFALFYEPA